MHRQGIACFPLIDHEDDGLDGLALFQPKARDRLMDELCAQGAAYLEGGDSGGQATNRSRANSPRGERLL